MWPFKRVPKPSPKRLIELEMAIEDVKVTMAWLKKGVVDLNARMATIVRHAKAPAETEDGGRTPATDASAPRAVAYDRPFKMRRGF
jgi:hypothetical protein